MSYYHNWVMGHLPRSVIHDEETHSAQDVIVINVALVIIYSAIMPVTS